MSSDLARYIQDVVVIDTHEHLCKEHEWVEQGPRDVLAELFNHYITADLRAAGASMDASRQLIDGDEDDIEERWAAIADAWQAVRFTGYGEAVRIKARDLYGIETFEPTAFRAAQPILERLRQPGERLRLLRDKARLDHVQTDDFIPDCLPDASGPDFFLYDLSWVSFARGELNFEQVANLTGITIKDVPSLDDAMAAVFDRFAPVAIAVKSQHAYHRTLRWQRRDKSQVARVLKTALQAPADLAEEDKLCLGDWCLFRGAELAAAHDLPLKLHTGYYAGNNAMIPDRIRPGHLAHLLQACPNTRFVLMHIGYPYSDELISLVKHYTNVWADLCWAWCVNPHHSVEFVRRFIHAAPANKLFGFGGDTFWPTTSYAFTTQMRRWLTRALEAEVQAGELTEAQAIELAGRFLRDNQLACFDLDGTRRNIQSARGQAMAM